MKKTSTDGRLSIPPFRSGSLAVAALLATANCAAQAQSFVSIRGAIDVNVRSVKNDTTLNSLSTNGTQGSRLAFLGQEDLGGGLKAGFWLETAYAPANMSKVSNSGKQKYTASPSGGPLRPGGSSRGMEMGILHIF